MCGCVRVVFSVGFVGSGPLRLCHVSACVRSLPTLAMMEEGRAIPMMPR